MKSAESSSFCWFALIKLSLYRLGIRKEDLPKYEEKLELNIAKAQLEELKKDAIEAMETQKKRYFLLILASLFFILILGKLRNYL